MASNNHEVRMPTRVKPVFRLTREYASTRNSMQHIQREKEKKRVRGIGYTSELPSAYNCGAVEDCVNALEKLHLIP